MYLYYPMKTICLSLILCHLLYSHLSICATCQHGTQLLACRLPLTLSLCPSLYLTHTHTHPHTHIHTHTHTHTYTNIYLLPSGNRAVFKHKSAHPLSRAAPKFECYLGKHHQCDGHKYFFHFLQKKNLNSITDTSMCQLLFFIKLIQITVDLKFASTLIHVLRQMQWEWSYQEVEPMADC